MPIPQSQIDTDHRPISGRRICPLIGLATGRRSHGNRVILKSNLKFYPSSGPGRNRVEIETRSDDQRTGIARRSPDIGFIERVSAKVKVFPRGIYIGLRPSDCWRATARCPTDARRRRYDTRKMNPMSGARQAITVR
ncbi:hypothetical protein DPMN_013886 [Dreissena polymorpha]|uniref:Uncharacterized protein n=1 Tax=Dreissena polymorpha TaxID=45954 RepID=A0A9D4N503_DREPO|nr:hypothetical protein DPMN_013886 [Dreissena polymorpha]